jgi:hypothetical protein
MDLAHFTLFCWLKILIMCALVLDVDASTSESSILVKEITKVIITHYAGHESVVCRYYKEKLEFVI